MERTSKSENGKNVQPPPTREELIERIMAALKDAPYIMLHAAVTILER